MRRPPPWRRRSAATGVAIAAVSGTYNMIHPDPEVRATGLRRLGVLIDHARRDGHRDGHALHRHPRRARTSGGITRTTTRPRPGAISWTRWPRPARWPKPKGVKLGIEPELANVIDGAARRVRLIDSLQSPALAIVLDPANLFEVEPLDRQRDILSQAIDLLADRIVMAHAKDRDPVAALSRRAGASSISRIS